MIASLEANVLFLVFTAIQLVFNPFTQFVPLVELYSQLQLNLLSDPIALALG